MTTNKQTENEQTKAFDFDYWRELAEKDPEQFEECRRRAINEVIDASPSSMQRRLRGLQWRVDMEIGRSKNAMDSCVRINRMMMDSVYAKDGLLDAIQNLLDASSSEAAESTAELLGFRKRS